MQGEIVNMPNKYVKLIKSGIKYLTDADYRFLIHSSDKKYQRIDDETYIKRKFKASLGYGLDLSNPCTFNEKLQWLKLYDRRTEYVKMVDKFLVRDYIAKTIGEEYLIPLIGAWDNPDDIPFEELPNQFVLKCNHNSGTGMCICRDKEKLDIEKTKAGLRKGLQQNYYTSGREWPYKDVPRKIICEKYMEDTSPQNSLNDYKFFCFNGDVKFFKVDFDRFIDHHANYYDVQGKLLSFGEADFPPKPDRVIQMPSNLEEMIKLARVLSKGFPFLRVDFYSIGEKVYFGELTLFPASGFGKWTDPKWDEIIGEWLVLPEKMENDY